MPGTYALKPMSWAYQGTAGNQATWTGGDAWFGGVGLCSSIVR